MKKRCGLSVLEIASQVTEMISAAAKEGQMLPRGACEIARAISSGDGEAIVFKGKVMSYAECRELDEAHIICSVIAKKECRGGNYGVRVMSSRLENCWQRNPNKKVALACSSKIAFWYERFGFQEQPKCEAPEYVRGGRSEALWLSSDRVWMLRTLKEP